MSEFSKKIAPCTLTSLLAKHDSSCISYKNRDVPTQLASLIKKEMLERKRLDSIINDCVNNTLEGKK